MAEPWSREPWSRSALSRSALSRGSGRGDHRTIGHGECRAAEYRQFSHVPVVNAEPKGVEGKNSGREV
jgi:hypothetical protein